MAVSSRKAGAFAYTTRICSSFEQVPGSRQASEHCCPVLYLCCIFFSRDRFDAGTLVRTLCAAVALSGRVFGCANKASQVTEDSISDKSVDKPEACPFLSSINHTQTRGYLEHLVRMARGYRRTLQNAEMELIKNNARGFSNH